MIYKCCWVLDIAAAAGFLIELHREAGGGALKILGCQQYRVYCRDIAAFLQLLS